MSETATPGATPEYILWREGGTSLAAPLIAGIQADVQQARGGAPLGFANPAIYARYGTPAYRDITSHGPPVALVNEGRPDLTVSTFDDQLRLLGQDSSLTTTRGYDDVTGVGTPTPAYLWSY